MERPKLEIPKISPEYQKIVDGILQDIDTCNEVIAECKNDIKEQEHVLAEVHADMEKVTREADDTLKLFDVTNPEDAKLRDLFLEGESIR